MTETESCCALSETFARDYRESLFYFSLKKTGDVHEAQDLAADIACNVLESLSRTGAPRDFPAWVWQIARNRYAAWTKAKRKQRVIGEPDETIPDGEDAIGAIGDAEEHAQRLAALRRELSFTSAEYRTVVAAYYLENRSVSDIAASLGVPAGTVKARLARARTKLKEGIGMARTFGKLSYNPENLTFVMNGLEGWDGSPWRYLSRLLDKNILLAAYRAPSTAEELAIETGVALPYMEEELSELTAATLLRKNGQRYETNLFIVSAAAQRQVYAHLREIAPALTAAILAAEEYERTWLDAECPLWREGAQSDADALWARMMEETDAVYRAVLACAETNPQPCKSIGKWGHTPRPCAGEWDVLGMETCEGAPMFVSLQGCVAAPEERELPPIGFQQFTFQFLGQKLFCQHLNYREAATLLAAANGCADDADNSIRERLTKRGFLTPDGRAACRVVRTNRIHPMPPEIQREYDARRAAARDIALSHYRLCQKLVLAEVPQFLRKDRYQIEHAAANLFELRGAVVEEALRTGALILPEDEARRGLLGAILRAE